MRRHLPVRDGLVGRHSGRGGREFKSPHPDSETPGHGTARAARTRGSSFRWIASVELGVGTNGKRLRKKITGPSRTAVADKLRKLQREQDAGVDVRKKSITVADLAHEWLSHLERNEGTKEEGTILRLRPRVERHIVPAGRIGGRQLDQLTVAQIEAWLRVEAESGGKGGKPQARVTCRDYKQMLGEMLEWAVARRYITWNPARLAKLPKDRSATNPDAPADLQQIAGEGIVHPRAVHEVDGVC